MIGVRQRSYAFQNEDFVPPYRSAANSAFPQHGVRVPGFQSPWLQVLKARFSELTSLPRGWDSYHGQPVSFECANFAAALLDRIYVKDVSVPALVPGSDGTLQIEWHKNNYDIEIDVIGANNVIASRYDHVSGAETVSELDNEFSELVTWIRDMASERADFAAASA